MATKSLDKMSEEELVERQIELSNKRAEAESLLKADQLSVQEAIDHGRVQAKFDRLSDSEKDDFRELLAEKETEQDG